jgi:hypothetical protein
LLANSIIYRYLCSEELLEDVLGGKDALRAFKESDEKAYLEVEVFFLLSPSLYFLLVFLPEMLLPLHYLAPIFILLSRC